MKRVRAAVAEGDKGRADSVLKLAIRQIDKAVGKGLWHRNAGARYISRLTSSVSSMK
jgi:small subunit ribosomal protein S20